MLFLRRVGVLNILRSQHTRIFKIVIELVDKINAFVKIVIEIQGVTVFFVGFRDFALDKLD